MFCFGLLAMGAPFFLVSCCWMDSFTNTPLLLIFFVFVYIAGHGLGFCTSSSLARIVAVFCFFEIRSVEGGGNEPYDE